MPIGVTGLRLDVKQLSIEEGESANLTATVIPSNAENKNVKWSSSNKLVASVEEGEVFAHREGETIITATSEDGNFTATCSVTVLATGQKPGENIDDNDETNIRCGTATLSLQNLTASTVTFAGSASTVSPDFQISLYYSLDERVQVQNAQCVSTYKLGSQNSFTLNVTNLQYDMTYYYCVGVRMNGKVQYSNIRSFKTDSVALNVESVQTGIMEAIFSGTMKLSEIDASSIKMSIEYGTDTTLSQNVGKLYVKAEGNGKWSVVATGLPITPTTYYYRTCISQESHNRNQYGEIMSFTTSVADVTFNNPSTTQTTATFKGCIKHADDGTFEVGVLYSSDNNLEPSSLNVKKLEVSLDADGNFNISAEQLQHGSEYFCRWYILANGKYTLGEIIPFKTKNIDIQINTSVTQTIATFEGVAILTEPQEITEFGVMYSSNSESFDATTAGVSKKIITTDSSGNYKLKIEGLTFDSEYHYRTYVLQNGIYKYGEITKFKTQNVVVNLTVKEASSTNATLEGMAELTERGYIEVGTLYSTAENFLSDLSSAERIVCAVGASGDVRETISNLNGDFSMTTYYYCYYIKQANKEVYGDILSFRTAKPDYSTYKDLSALGTANCYMITEPGIYKLKTVKGNSNISVGDVESSSVVWESFGSNIKPNVGDLVKRIGCSEDYIAVEITTPFSSGNALIAARDANGTILWSWHLWLLDELPGEQEYNNNAGTLMDINLGAVSGNINEWIGLLYQWGRKDPFLGVYEIGANSRQYLVGNYNYSNKAASTVESSIRYPTAQFYGTQDTSFDWLKSSNSNLWSSEKTIYDPCPSGWRVPDGGESGVWSVSQYRYTYHSCQFGGQLDSDGCIFYPYAGRLFQNTYSKEITQSGEYGFYWSCTASNSRHSYGLQVNADGMKYLSSLDRAIGASVRCQKESK